MGKATNCSEACRNYDHCVKEGITEKFLLGGECTDFSPVDKDE